MFREAETILRAITGPPLSARFEPGTKKTICMKASSSPHGNLPSVRQNNGTGSCASSITLSDGNKFIALVTRSTFGRNLSSVAGIYWVMC